MRKIQNRSEAHELYATVNRHIDDYMQKWKIDAKDLKKYLDNKDKLNNFLIRTELGEIENIERIIRDVLVDRVAIEKDNLKKSENVMKFESFVHTDIENSDSFVKFDNPSIEHEKVLADFFKVSLSQVELIESDLHLYLVDDFGEEMEISIFTDDEVEHFKKELTDYTLKIMKNKELDLHDLDFQTNIAIKLSDIVDEEKYKNKLSKELTEKKVCELLTDWLNTQGNFEYLKKFHDNHLWIKK